MVTQKAGTVLINKEKGQIALVYRKKLGDLSFPKGHLEEGETLEECAIRETIEETGRNCHLVSNDSNYMVIGAVYCPKHKVKKVNEYIEHLKENYNISNKIELKWNKIDRKTEKLYLDVINYFFNNDDLKFRVIVIDKTKLDHDRYNQTENDFYHKAYYEMLKYIIVPGNTYNIYPDIKDTNSYYYHQEYYLLN